VLLGVEDEPLAEVVLLDELAPVLPLPLSPLPLPLLSPELELSLLAAKASGGPGKV